MIISNKCWNKFIIVLLLLAGTESISRAQNLGEAWLLRKSYYSRLLNPSLSRSDNKIEFAFPFLAGFSASMQNTFRLTDLIYTQPNGELSYDLNRFYNKLGNHNQAGIEASVPLFYFSIQQSGGQLSFYIKENFMISSSFPKNTFLWFETGNNAIEARNFSSGNINVEAMGYHEFAAGYTASGAGDWQIGGRVKFILAQAKVSFKNWNYNVKTSEEGELIEISSAGEGTFSLANEMIIKEGTQLGQVQFTNPVKNYFGAFRNPGIAFDFAVSSQKNNALVSAGISDLGVIWYKTDAWNISQKGSYAFKGINITNSLDSKKGQSYIMPLDLMQSTTDSIRLVYQPYLDSARFVSVMFPRVYFQYSKELLGNIEVGISNSMRFYRNAIANNFSTGITKTWGSFSAAATLNIFQLKTLSVGAGVFWENRFMQAFLFADNLYAAYYPANSKSYSLSAGVAFLFESKTKTKTNKRKGRFSKYLPYYRNYH